MKIQEPGVLSDSERYFFTPSSFAEQVLFYPTRVAHFYCTSEYHFSGFSEIGMEPSHHMHFMLFATVSGSMVLRLDGRSFTAGKGDLVLFDCKRPHEYSALSSGVEFFWLVFDGNMMENSFDQILALHGDRNAFPAADFGRMTELLSRLLTIASSKSYTSEVALSELIYSVLCGLFLTQKTRNGHASAFIEQALRYIDRNYREPILVPDIASAVGVSASYFNRSFRRETGYSPHEYLTLRRVSAAKDLLISTNAPLREIAFECGYASEENFIRAFRGAVGVSPSSFRRYPV